MPDRDVIYASLAPAWRRPYRLAKGDASPETWAPSGEKALSDTLRRVGGCPGIDGLGSAVVEGVRGRSWEEAADAAARAGGSLRNTTAIAREIATAFVQAHAGDMAGRSDREVAIAYAEEVLRRMVLQQGFGPAQATLAGERFGSWDRLVDFEDQCLDAMRLRALAESLLNDPTASRLRAPATRRNASTPEMLERWP